MPPTPTVAAAPPIPAPRPYLTPGTGPTRRRCPACGVDAAIARGRPPGRSLECQDCGRVTRGVR